MNCISSETNSFNKRYDDLERFLLKRGYSSKLVGKEILWARKIPRNELLYKKKSQGNDRKLTFNVMYFPMFRHLKNQLKELLFKLACVEGHKKVFPEVPIIEVGRCEPCGGKRPPCKLCSNMINTSTFKGKHSNEVYKIKKKFN